MSGPKIPYFENYRNYLANCYHGVTQLFGCHSVGSRGWRERGRGRSYEVNGWDKIFSLAIFFDVLNDFLSKDGERPILRRI